MKVTVSRPTKIDIKAVCIIAPDRYNGEDFEDFPKGLPHYNGDSLTLVIDLDTVKVRDWPTGKPWRYYGKVVDEGRYALVDAEDNVLATIEDDYVPKCLPGEYGDYLDIAIDANGVVSNFKPDADEFVSSFFPS